MVTIIANYRARPEAADKVAATLSRHVAATRTEPGCLQFVAYRSHSEPTRFVLYEQYRDEDAVSAHRETEHFRAYVEETIIPLLDERHLERLDEVAPASGGPVGG